MSIVPLRKATLFGRLDDKPSALKALQDLGALHVVSLRPKAARAEVELPPGAQRALRALQYLAAVPERRKQLHHDPAFDVEALIRQVEANREALRDYRDRIDFLRARIAKLEPWGDFRLPPLSDLAGVRLWFYVVPHRYEAALEQLELPWQAAHRGNRENWVVVLSRDEPPADLLPVPRTHTGAKPLSSLRLELEQAEVEMEALLSERQALTRFLYLLGQNLARAEDRAAFTAAAGQALDGEATFVLQGWVPEERGEELLDFAKQQGLALFLEAPAPEESVPTLLDNPPATAAGEDLIRFYQMPSADEWDPSSVVFFSFAAFFAMILSDAGYAAILLALLLAFWHPLGRKSVGRRLRPLALVVTVAALVWGVLAGSYFGLEPPSDSLLGAVAIIDLQDFNAMMTLSILVGAAHVAIANAAVAWRFRGQRKAWAKLGWLFVLAGALILWLGGMGAPRQAGLGLVGLGLLAVFFCSGERPIRRRRDYALRLLEGLLALTGVSRIFGDVLSYLRLFALGLASASLAITFNDLAAQVRDTLPGIGLFFEILILFLGHGLNLLLAVMSGVVHGLRLNYIEFNNWALAREGFPFQAFRRKEEMAS